MKKSTFINRVLLLAVLTMLFSACSKKYRYDFMNGYTDAEANDSIQLDIDTSKLNIDLSKIGEARLFPGVVSEKEPRLQDYDVNLDLDYQQVKKSDLRISVLPKPWFSTGLYAPPGEMIEIDVPDGVYGLNVQIGVWTDNNSGKDKQLRDPLIVNKKALFPGKNHVRNLYGGPLMIIASRSLGKNVDLKISGAVKSPDFVLGETTDAEWEQMIQNTSVPWFELRGKRIIFDLPVAKLKTFPLTNPTALMKAWDSVITEDYNAWYGLSDEPTDSRDRAPDLAWRVVQDIQPSAGYGHNGYPVVALLDDNWFKQVTNLHTLRNSGNWGTLHELGHNFQMNSTWRWSDLGEVSNNLHSFKVANRYGHEHSKMKSGDFTRALSKAASGIDDFSDLNFTERLVPFVQVLEYYGYDFMTYLTTQARHEQHTSINNQIKIDFFYEKLSEFTKHDMLPFMNQWGLYPSTQAQSKIASENNITSMRYDVWNYNPWTGTGGDKQVLPARPNWEVVEYCTDNGDNAKPVHLFDGDIHSVWNTYANGWSSDTYPHHVTIDMHSTKSPEGFYIVQRQSADGTAGSHGFGPWDQDPKHADIYVGMDANNLQLAIEDILLPVQDEPINIDLPTGIAPFRYFKIELTSGWLHDAGITSNFHHRVAQLAEVGIY